MITYAQIINFDTQAEMNTTLGVGNGQFGWCKDIQAVFNFNGTVWMPSSKVSVKKSLTLVTGTATGITKIYTTEATSLNFYPTSVIFRAGNISGVTIRPTVSVGTNSSNYDNIVTTSLLTTVLSTLSANSGAPQLASISIPIGGSTDIFVKVSIAGSATSYTFYVEVIGFYDI